MSEATTLSERQAEILRRVVEEYVENGEPVGSKNLVARAGMPEPLSEEELESIIDDAIAECGATSLRQLGRVMADVMPQVAGRADGSAVSQLVREKLA